MENDWTLKLQDESVKDVFISQVCGPPEAMGWLERARRNLKPQFQLWWVKGQINIDSNSSRGLLTGLFPDGFMKQSFRKCFVYCASLWWDHKKPWKWLINGSKQMLN